MNPFIGPALFAVGIMVAISGGAKLADKIGAWPDSTPIFIGGAVVAAVGLVLWRRQRAATRVLEQKAMDAGGDHSRNPFQLLERLIGPASALGDEMGHLGHEAICVRVDELLEAYVLPFAEVRQRVIDRLGMTAGAEILVTMAFGERMLNRTWSAAGDHHLPEARACFPDALEAFHEAQAQAKAALAKA